MSEFRLWTEVCLKSRNIDIAHSVHLYYNRLYSPKKCKIYCKSYINLRKLLYVSGTEFPSSGSYKGV